MKASRKLITILMTSHDEEDRLMVQKAFERARLAMDLRFVPDGQALMDYLLRRGEHGDPEQSPRPGLILLECNKPCKDGQQTLREIKAIPQLKSIPIVVFTRSSAREDVQQCYAHHAASYITRPVSFDELVEVIQTLGQYWLEVVELPDKSDL